MNWKAAVIVVALFAVGCSGTDEPMAEPPSPTTSPASTTTGTIAPADVPVVLPASDPADAVVCHSFGVSYGPPPATELQAEALLHAIDWFLGDLDPRIPSVIEQRWADATAGPRAVQAEWQAVDGDWTAIDWDAPEFATDAAARADLQDWCRRSGIDPGSPGPRPPQQPVPPRSDPPQDCANTYRLVYLGDDLTADWVLPSEASDGSTYEDQVDWVVCDSQRDAPWSFPGPSHHETFLSIDVDEDGIDDFIAIGGTTVNAFFGALWALTDDRITPLLTEEGAQARLESSGWWVETDSPTGWYGCGYFGGSGDGVRRLASGTYDVMGERIAAVGEEWTIEGDRIVARTAFATRFPRNDDTFPGLQGCRSAAEVRAEPPIADPAPG